MGCHDCTFNKAGSIAAVQCVNPSGVPNYNGASCLVYNRREQFAGKEVSDGSTASYYELPAGVTQLQDLISDRNMNAQIGEIFRACYRMGRASHSDTLRDARKILFYAQAEVARLEKGASK